MPCYICASPTCLGECEPKIKSSFNHKEASEQIAKIYGIYIIKSDLLGNKYITKDLGILMELAIRDGIKVFYDPDNATAEASYLTIDGGYVEEHISFAQSNAHNNDPIEATRVAIAKALIKKGGK